METRRLLARRTLHRCHRASGLGTAILALLVLPHAALQGADQPQWGQRHTRNMVSAETGLPDSFDPETGRNIKWAARLGSETHSTPVVSGGFVLIGTNNEEPRDPKHRGDRGVLMCFRESDGGFRWQLVTPKLEPDPYMDWPKMGIASSPTVVGDRVYLLSNQGEVLCLDLHGMANGNQGPFLDEGRHMSLAGQPALEPGPTDADILWACDLVRNAGIYPHDSAHSSILVLGDLLYLNTSTGVDNTHKSIRTPDAPSLVVIDRHSGRLLARDHAGIAPNIFHAAWSSPSHAVVDGRSLIFLGGGDGWLYAFEPLRATPPQGDIAALSNVWRFDCDPTAPKQDVHRFNGNRREGPSNILGMPVVHDGKVYVAAGGDLWWGKNEARLHCIDAAKAVSGDVTGSAGRWSHPLRRHGLSTPSIHGDLLFIADAGHTIHCLDLRSGQPIWTQETNGEIWASTLVADGKVFVGTRRGVFYVMSASREKRVLSTLTMNSPISASAVAANGVVYVATMKHLYAIATSR